jgi:hypothetical protein
VNRPTKPAAATVNRRDQASDQRRNKLLPSAAPTHDVLVAVLVR